jgi:hypothetical protein
LNAYPDITFGLIKRSGGQFIAELKNAAGVVYSPTTFDNGKWFSIFRDGTEKYLGVIKGTGIYVWDIQTGAPKTVTMVGSASSYLTGTIPSDYQTLSINDYTYITNRKKVVTAQATPAAQVANRAFVSIRALVYNSTYNIILNGTTYSYTSPTDATGGPLTVDKILNSTSANPNQGLRKQIDDLAAFTATAAGAGFVIESASAFTISVNGGSTGDALEVFQLSVPNISKLPTQCKNGYVVKVANTQEENDDYYVEFKADNGTYGPGVWEETRSPDVSPGFTNSTMPHELVRLSNGTFEFREVSWEDRLVGDDTSNPQPSFVGSNIEQMFFYRNRLGILTQNNVVMSQSGDYVNFYAQSALTNADSDSIDVTVSTTKPATLKAVVPVVQGLVLFSANEQFLLSATSESLTPSSVNVKTISRYDYDPLNNPADLGTTIAFIAKSPAYTRVHEMETLGGEESPFVEDKTRVVPEYIPSSIDLIAGSGQSSLLALGSSTSRDVYLFSYFSTGQKRLSEAWFQWKLSGILQYHVIDNDVYWAVTKQASSYVIQKHNLIQSPQSSTLQTTDGSRIDPRLDMWKSNATTVLSGDNTKVYLPFKHDSSLPLCIVIANSTTSGPDYSNSGTIFLPSTIAQDGTGWYALIENRNLTTENLIVGYCYNYEVELPKIYYRSGDNGEVTDYSAYLTIARMKFIFGLTGDVSFQLKAKGRSDWQTLAGTKTLNVYKLNDIPFVAEGIYTLPIHQRTDNFSVKVTSNTPFPVSLISMIWEGNYSPRFYTRKY